MAQENRTSRRGVLLAASLNGTIVAVVALGVLPGALPGESNTDCAAAYNSYLKSLEGKQISPQRRATLRHWALRVYDACDTGDIGDPKTLFERLEREGH